MFLSRIAINPYLPHARDVLSNTRDLHCAVMGMFDSYVKDTHGKSTDRSAGSGVPLWRLDAAVDSLSLLVVSGEKPNTSALVNSIGWADGTDNAVVIADYDAFLDSIEAGQRYAFRVTANMVRRRNGAVTSVAASPSAKMEWIAVAAKRHGFRIINLPEITSLTDTFTKGSGLITLDKSTVNGHLEVIDPASVRAALTAGVGRGRAYGCGLLTLAPCK